PMEGEGFTSEYRRSLAENFFYKFYLHVALAVDPKQVSKGHTSAANHDIRELSHGTQEFNEYPELYPLTKPIIKRAAFVQASGEVKFTQDVGLPLGGLHAAMVKSSRPHARFAFTQKLDALQETLRQRYADFHAFITAADIPPGGNNLIGLGE